MGSIKKPPIKKSKYKKKTALEKALQAVEDYSEHENKVSVHGVSTNGIAKEVKIQKQKPKSN